MHKMQTQLPERGLLNLVKQKLDQGITSADIEDMLCRAGVKRHEVRDALAHISYKGGDDEGRSKDIESNEFLPPLSKNLDTLHDQLEYKLDTFVAQEVPFEIQNSAHITPLAPLSPHPEKELERVIHDEIAHSHLFAGRLRRKDFIIGLLFFFGLGFIFFITALTWVQEISPDFASMIDRAISYDRYGMLIMLIPLIFAPVTVMILSLIARRLHNMNIPGWISFLYLSFFLNPLFGSGIFGRLGLVAFLIIEIALVILFIYILSKKGKPAPNKHGEHPASHGSFMKRIVGNH